MFLFTTEYEIEVYIVTICITFIICIIERIRKGIRPLCRVVDWDCEAGTGIGVPISGGANIGSSATFST